VLNARCRSARMTADLPDPVGPVMTVNLPSLTEAFLMDW
jgi:hypothetical protein